MVHVNINDNISPNSMRLQNSPKKNVNDFLQTDFRYRVYGVSATIWIATEFRIGRVSFRRVDLINAVNRIDSCFICFANIIFLNKFLFTLHSAAHPQPTTNNQSLPNQAQPRSQSNAIVARSCLEMKLGFSTLVARLFS